jgi:DNA-binding NtrC family response regulator
MLSGCRVLLVEDDPLVNETISALIADAEGVVVGPATSLAEARRALKSGVPFDVAVLDMNVGDGEVTPVLEGLRARRVPIVIYSGGDVPEAVRKRHPDLISLRKPVTRARLLAELKRARGLVLA